jgi:hypothetical protein
MNTAIKHIYATDAFCFAMNTEALLHEYDIILEGLNWTARAIG